MKAKTDKTLRKIHKALCLIDNHEIRQTLQGMRESANLGGDVFFANAIADLQVGIHMIRRLQRSIETVHVLKPDQKQG